MKVGAIIAIGIVAFGIFMATRGGSAINKDIADFCVKSPDQVEKVLTTWETAGVIRDVRRNTVIVDEPRWEDAAHNGKVSIGIAIYCRAGGGEKTGYVRGYRDNKIKATVSAGHYFD